MGRPLNKRYLGAPTAAGTEIKCQFNIGGGSLPGYIVKQVASRRFKVSNAGGTSVGICKLVDKASGALGTNEMSLVVDDDGTARQVVKISGRMLTMDNGVKIGWGFAAAVAGVRVEIEEAGTARLAGADATLGTADDVLAGADDIEGDG